jgi:hypothetical protein
MSYMEQAAFGSVVGIHELSLEELGFVCGADGASDVGDAATWVAAGAAMVAGVATVTAPATGGTSGVVAAGAGIVAGVATLVAVVAYAVSDD